jgi:magnesium transporter
MRGEKLVAFRAFRARARRNDYDMDYKDPTWILLGNESYGLHHGKHM